MLKKNLRAIVNANSDPCGAAWITARNVAATRALNVSCSRRNDRIPETRTRDACATQMEMFRLAAETDRLAARAPQSLHSVECGGAASPFLVSEETAAANDLSNLRRDHLVPAFVSGGDTFEHVP